MLNISDQQRRCGCHHSSSVSISTTRKKASQKGVCFSHMPFKTCLLKIVSTSHEGLKCIPKSPAFPAVIKSVSTQHKTTPCVDKHSTGSTRAGHKLVFFFSIEHGIFSSLASKQLAFLMGGNIFLIQCKCTVCGRLCLRRNSSLLKL